MLNPTNVTSSTLTDYASISAPLPVNVSGVSSVSLSVKNQVNSAGYPAGTFAGFDVENTEVIGASLLSSTTIKTYLNGVLSETVTGGSSLVSIPLLTATGRQTIGFVTSQPFNEVQIVFSFPATLSVGETRIYSAILKSFCAGPTITCSTSAVTPLTNTSFPVYINNDHTGTGSSLVCVGCAINNADNVINGSTSSPATISLGTAVSATARLSVANPIDTYPAESYIGFDIESSTLIGASLLGRTRITLYNNGSAVQTGSGASLLAGVSLVSGNRQTVGTVAQVPFDEVEIEFTQLVSANPLGTVSIYRAVIQKACVTPVACNQTKFLNTTDFSAFIEGTRTGLFGLVSADLLGSGVANPGNAISPSTTDFARITNVLGVGVTASISVADPADVYPAGTFAGFTISKANLPVSANLFSNLTVNTYLNGVFQESSATVGNLIDLSVFLQIFGGVPSSDLANVGFVTSKSFDEIQLSVGSFASVGNFVDVYGAFIDTRTSSNGGSLVCNFVINPDFNVTTKNVPVSGNVSTNDKVPAGTTYGTPSASSSNPSGATITLATTGVYNFTATTPGTYTYTVPVCATGQTSCPTTPLIITVLDQSIATNKPVANPDYASVQSSTAAAGSVAINVKANDGAGNPGGVLGAPTITINPTHGTAIIDGSGNIVYTPATSYIGDDILTYEICETPGGLCAPAQVIVHVVAPGSSTVTVADDYTSTKQNAPITGNVLTNDLGTGLTVSNAGTISSPGKGTLIITSAGSYTFTPATDVTGPVDFTYTACDGGTPAACGTATLHILINKVPDLAIISTIQPSTIYGTSNFTLVGEVYELNSSAVTGPITVYIAKDPLFVLSFDGAAVFVGGKVVNNSVWTFDATNKDFYILTTNAGLVGGTKRVFGLTGVFTPGNTRGSIGISSLIVASSSGELNLTNNSDADSIDYFNK
ncbi:Ig-like domain-containing protein [Spirosoma endophyticum]|uniref:Ig-like domain-containing protein n=1 Tax=Spirosoma endophyticum TaxID=662367 RepID=UPI001160289A|nr:Ig-like domain-containing protein [Spirosoma endophyticum]